jgi:hypothetical protein
MNSKYLVKVNQAFKVVLNEKAKPTGFTWGNIMTIWIILPVTVSVILMIYTETPIMCKPYLIFVPSIVITMFVIFTRNSVWLKKDFKI